VASFNSQKTGGCGGKSPCRPPAIDSEKMLWQHSRAGDFAGTCPSILSFTLNLFELCVNSDECSRLLLLLAGCFF
jgi:hypothetical protein